MNKNYVNMLNLVPVIDVICFLDAIKKECIIERGKITSVTEIENKDITTNKK